MRKSTAVVVCLLAAVAWSYGGEPTGDADKNWPQWRGPTATGAASHGNPPIEWSESKNIRWKVAIPGRGHASPIVWGDRIYIQTAIKTEKKAAGKEQAQAEPQTRQEQGRGGRRGRGRGRFGGGAKPTNIYKFVLMALDRKTGKTIWERTASEQLPHEGGHRDSTQASASPVTDGEHIIAHFGSRGIYCYDMNGELQWSKDLGDMRTRNSFGEGSSPAIHGDTVVITWDHEGDSFIIALDKRTGEQRWKVARDERTTWATPLVIEHDGMAQVVTSATNRIRSYDLATGKLIWECGGMTANVIPSPVSGFGLVYAISGFRGNSLQAIRYADAKGDITNGDAIAWKHDKGTPYVPSPLLYEDKLYFLDNNKAILSCFDAKSGKEHYGQKRIEGVRGVYASPVGAGGHVYITGRDGKTVVLKHGPEFEILATNELDDGFDASPAIVGDELYLRGRKNLYCIARN